MLGEVNRTPATRNLREVRGVRMRKSVIVEESAGIERSSSLKFEFNVLLLVKADAKQLRRYVASMSISVLTFECESSFSG